MAAQEDKLFEAKIEDCLRLGEKRPAFLGFLDLSERAYAEEYLRKITDFSVAFPKRSERFWACFLTTWNP